MSLPFACIKSCSCIPFIIPISISPEKKRLFAFNMILFPCFDAMQSQANGECGVPFCFIQSVVLFLFSMGNIAYLRKKPI